jgi:hypothetical protein
MPDWLLNLGNPATGPMVAVFGSAIIATLTTFSFSNFLETAMVLLTIFGITLIICVVVLVPLFTARGSFFEALRFLYYVPDVLIQMDRKFVRIESGRAEFGTPNVDGLQFAVAEVGISRGLQLDTGKGSEPVIFLLYHRFFEHLLLGLDELKVLSAKLNDLRSEAAANAALTTTEFILGPNPAH